MIAESGGGLIPLRQEQLADMLFAAAQELFTSMLGSAIQRLPEHEAERSESFDGVLSLIGLAGAVVGNGALFCTAPVACVLSSRLLMSEFSAVDDEVLDSVGEITNMIIGGLKTSLERFAGQLQMSIPTVIYGKNIAARNPRADMVGAVRCGFPGGECELVVRLAGAVEGHNDVRSSQAVTTLKEAALEAVDPGLSPW